MRFSDFSIQPPVARAATATKASKARALPKFWVSICSYKKQPVKKNWGRILDLAWLKLAVAALQKVCSLTLSLLIIALSDIVLIENGNHNLNYPEET